MQRPRSRLLGFAALGVLAAFTGLVALGAVVAAGQDGGQASVLSAHAQLLTDPVPITDRLRSGFGYFAILAIAALFSRNRRAIDTRLVVLGVGTHLAFSVVLLIGGAAGFFRTASDAFLWVSNHYQEGAKFLFASFRSGQQEIEPPLANFVFLALPVIIFFCSLMTMLYHMGVMQPVVKGMAWVMQKTMRTSGAETLSAAANIFVGQTEAPLVVKPYLAKMTLSELMAIMTGGFATIAGSVLALYAGFLGESMPGIAAHLMAASVLNAPSGLLVAKILVPEEGVPETRGTLQSSMEKPDTNLVGAAARGASEGMTLALNVAAMLLAFVAIVALLNGCLAGATSALGLGTITIERLLGWAAYPFAWLMGVRLEDCAFVSVYLGEKVVLTELLAYKHLATALGEGAVVHQRSATITVYALLGFANFASIGIQIGGIGGLAPERRGDLAKLGLRAMLAGTFAAYLSGCLVGALG